VVRQDYCNRIALDSAIRQFEFVDAKILGVVFNCINEHGGKYGSRYYKRYYRKYYNRYYRSYDSSRGQSDRQPEHRAES